MKPAEIYKQVLQAIARGYCVPPNTGKVVDPILCDAMTREVMAVLPKLCKDDGTAYFDGVDWERET